MEEIPRQLQADWISAFGREDGYRLMILLGQEPRLVTVKHRRCNVLHLAMRNNWYGLVQEILQKFNHLHKEAASPISGTSLPSSTLKAGNAEKEHNIDAPSFLGGPSNSQGSEAAEVGRSGASSPSSSSKAANAAQDHNMDAPPLLGGPSNSQGSEAADHRQITRELKSCPTGDSQAHPGEHGTKHGSALDLAAFRDLLLAKEGFVGAQKGKKKKAKQGDGESSTEDTKILSDIPKASGFDVFAMAVIKGHPAINKMLVEAVSQVDSLFDKGHPYRNVIRRIAYEEERVRRPHDRERELLGELLVMADQPDVEYEYDSGYQTATRSKITERLIEFYAKVPASSSSSFPATEDGEGAAHREQGNPGSSSRNLKNRLENKIHHRTWWEQWKLISPFLHFEEFLFLAYCLHPSVFLADRDKYLEVRHAASRLLRGCAKHMETRNNSFVKYLLSINDTWGSAIHHALLSEQRDSGTTLEQEFSKGPGSTLYQVLEMIPDELSSYVKEGDSLGRTPLHIAVALGLKDGISTLLTKKKARSLMLETEENCEGLRIADCEWEINVNIVSQVNGFMPYKVPGATYRRTPFQLAIHSPHLRQPEREQVIRLLVMPSGGLYTVEWEEVSCLRFSSPDMRIWVRSREMHPVFSKFSKFTDVTRNEVVGQLDMTEGEDWSLGVELATVASSVGDFMPMVHSQKLTTPLQIAAYLGDAAAVQILAHHLSTGCDTARLDNFFSDWVVYHLPSWSWSWVPSLRRASVSPFPFYIRSFSLDDRPCMCSVLHFAAMGAHPHVIKTILASGKFDPLIQDSSGNTALHLALRCEVPEQVPHVLADFCEIPFTRIDREQRSLFADKRRELESRRQGCVNLLLQAGIDAWQTNEKYETADPGPKASPEYSTWWYEKLSKETLEAKTSLSAAANAVSVTAALVATASYVGPLQPPLGYAAPSEGLVDKMQVDVLSVRVFIVCNTLAFYLALAAIVLSLTPALPMPRDPMLDELGRIRRTVTAAVFLLVLSILAVLLAFGFASIAVIPDEGSWNHGGLTVSTLGVGGFVCSIALLLCIFRLFKLLFHKSRFMRILYRKFVPM